MPEKLANTVWHNVTVTREMRNSLNGHKSVILWFTGFSGSGKSTLAHAIEEKLYQISCRTFVLDGDNIRHGLNFDLGFGVDDRRENIRRIGEVAKLMLESGVILLSSFISPYKADRESVRKSVPHGDFIEIFCNASIDVCESRDLKGLYKRARSGEIKNFTGISDPYEMPEKPELVVNTGSDSLEVCVESVFQLLVSRGII